MLIKELTQKAGVSGSEGEVRAFILDNIKADEVIVDSMGNVIAHKKGRRNKKVMACAHMDEVGFIITSVTDDGFLKFKTVGGIDPVVLCSKRVLVGKDKIKGVIGTKAVHLIEPEQRKSAVKVKDLYIDIGAKSKSDVKVEHGDYAVFDSDYAEFGDGFVKAKALDDRVGCAILIELLKEDFDFDFYAAFTVQEEVGLRGAKVAANRIAPDMALVLEGTTCTDTYRCEPHQVVTSLGAGPALTVMDSAAVVDRGLLEDLIKIAEENRIPYQIKRTTMGGTDAGSIQRSNAGAKVVTVSVPCRYIHSPVSVMNRSDAENALRLTKAFLNKQ